MSKETNQDMGTGSVKKLMVQMAVPAVVGQVINLLYNVVDRIYIGHIPEIGGAALTGVGLFTPILMLITAFAMLAGAGGAPRAAIAMGKGDRDTAEKIVANCFTVLLLLSVVLTGVFYGTLPTLVRLFGGSDVTLPYAVQYGRIYVLGSVFVLVVMGMNPFITTQGFAGTSMLTTVIGAVINIVLDPIFIFVFDMGVAGAAIATVLSQAVSAVWILRFLTGRKTILRLKARNMLLQGKIILPCLALGISNFVMVSTESILSVSFTSSLSRYGGDVAVGAMTVLTSVNQLITMPLQGICQGGQPLISYNYGAKKVRAGEGSLFLPVPCVRGVHHRVLAAGDGLPQSVRGHLYQRRGACGLHGLGDSDFPCGDVFRGLSGQLSTGVYGAGAGEDQSHHGLSAEADSADSSDLHSAELLCGQGVRGLSGGAGVRHPRRRRDDHYVLYLLPQVIESGETVTFTPYPGLGTA